MDSIASRRNLVVSRCRRLRAGRSEGDPALLLDGWHLVSEALRAGLRVELIAVSASALESPNDAGVAVLADARRRGVRVLRAGNAVMQAISPVRSPAGVVAIAHPPVVVAERLVQPSPALVMIAVDVQEPGNLGAILRVVEGAEGTGVVAAGASADPFGWKALRGSMGSAFRLPVVREPDAARAIDTVRSLGARVLATGAGGGPTLYDCDLRRDVAVLLGSEGRGLTPEIAARADGHLAIPIRGIESLNVATAAAVIAYEAWRQRHGGGEPA